MALDAAFWVGLGQIVWINILLSGDNAVVIALACRSLPKRQQTWGIILGTLPAIVLRIVFAVFIAYLMEIPWLKLIGGALLFWIAIKMLQGEDEAHGADGEGAGSLWAAVRTIVIADAVMSLDNVIAIAAAAKGSFALLVIGLVISMPLVIFGSALLLKVLTRWPVLVTAGAALLGWIAGEVIITDPAVAPWIETNAHALHDYYLAAALGAVIVVATGQFLARMKPRHKEADIVT